MEPNRVLLKDLGSIDLQNLLPADMPYRDVILSRVPELTRPPTLPFVEPSKSSAVNQLAATLLVEGALILVGAAILGNPLYLLLVLLSWVLSLVSYLLVSDEIDRLFSRNMDQFIRMRASNSIQLAKWSGSYLDLVTGKIGHPDTEKTVPVTSLADFMLYLELFT